MPPEKIYNLTCDNHRFISLIPPNSVPDSYYSLIEVINNDNNITIKGIYVGGNKSEVLECIFTDVMINTSLNKDNKLEKYIESLSTQDKKNIISNYEIVDIDNWDIANTNNINNTVKKIFLIGLGSVLVYLYFIVYCNLNKDYINIINYVFFPIKIVCPIRKVKLSVITKKIFEYLSYPSKLLINMNIQSPGKLWAGMILDFYNSFEEIIPETSNTVEKIKLNQYTNKLIYKSVLGYSDYLYNQISNLSAYYNQSETIITTGSSQLKKITLNSLDVIKNSQHNFKKQFKYASLLLTTIATLILKTIKYETDVSIEEIKDCKNNYIMAIDKLIDHVKQIESSLDEIKDIKSNTLNEMETHKKLIIDDIINIKTIMTNDINTNKQESLEKLENKTKEYLLILESSKNNLCKEIEKKEDIVTSQYKEYIQEIYKIKKLILQEINNKIPDLISQMHDTVSEVIYKNINEKIELKYKEIMAEYSKKMETSLLEALDPVVIRKVNTFNQEAEQIINTAKLHSNVCRVNANKVRELISNHNKRLGNIDERITSLEFSVNSKH